ncbi:NYN domain-containing protein [Candidatus Gracilibacteria bacterium]|nr:NYN domain-containing protein [Candidatus Gracilibacteria bacterium]
MIIRNPEQRVAILVDVQNLYYSAKNLYHSRVNFKNILGLILQGRKLTRAIAYAVDTAEETNKVFIDAIHESGFEIKKKPIQTFVDGSKKADWDVGIAMDAIRLGSKVDSIILVSGDGDYVPVVNYLQQSQGCLVEVMAFGRTTNKELRELADEFIDIEEYPDELLFQSRKSVRPQRNEKNRTEKKIQKNESKK